MGLCPYCGELLYSDDSTCIDCGYVTNPWDDENDSYYKDDDDDDTYGSYGDDGYGYGYDD